MLHVLESFRTVSGLRQNSEKTEVLWISANTGRDETLCPEKKIEMGTEQSKISRRLSFNRPESNHGSKLF